MEKIAIVLMAAAMLTSALPAIAAEGVQEREMCAISANTCLNRAEILERKIKKINAELKRCNVKFSPVEMKKLDQRLQEAIDQLDKVEGNK